MPFTPTYTYQEIVTYVQRLVKGIPISDIDEVCVGQINSIFWLAYPWRWTRAIVTPVTLVDGTQDYQIVNTDLWKLLSARVRLNGAGGALNQYRDLRIMRWLEPDLVNKVSWPNMQLICHNLNTDRFRFEGAIASPSVGAMQLEGEYWLQPAKITNLASVITFPDFYFNVLAEGILWLLYRLADDARAGTAQLVRGQVVYTGQLGVFIDAMMSAKEKEESGAGDTIYPEAPLSGSDFSGLLGQFGG